MRGDCLFRPDFLEDFGAALDRALESEGPSCLVVTGEASAFSPGFDLEVLRSGAEAARSLVEGGIALLGRLLALPIPSVAAVNGHAFGLGAMLALACDWRCMRADRGWFCLPEIDLGMPLTPAMSALLACKLEPAALRSALLTGRRIGGEEAAGLAIVDEACPEDTLEARALARVLPLAGKDRSTYASLKRGLYRRALEIIES